MKYRITRKIISAAGSVQYPEMVLQALEKKLQNFDGRVVSVASFTNPQYMDKCQQQICFWALVEQKARMED